VANRRTHRQTEVRTPYHYTSEVLLRAYKNEKNRKYATTAHKFQQTNYNYGIVIYFISAVVVGQFGFYMCYKNYQKTADIDDINIIWNT